MITAVSGRRLLAAALIAFFAALQAHAQHVAPVLGDPRELRDFIDPLIRKEITGERIPGAVVAIVREGEPVYAAGYGFASLERKIPMVADRSILRIGPITGLFTATAVMQLAEQGRIRLDDDVNRYLHAFRVPDACARPVTIANLLTHTGGFEERLAGTCARGPEDVLPLERFLALRLPPRVFPPGDIISYSSQGYTLLGYLVESVTGVPYDRYVEENVLRPLGMERSGFTLPARLKPDLAPGYEVRRGSYRETPQTLLNIVPAAGMSATAGDIARFMTAQLDGGSCGGGRILGEATVHDMQSRHFANHEGLPGMTWGFFEGYYFNRRCLYVAGKTSGYAALLCLIPDQKVGIFISDNGYREDVLWVVLNAFLSHYYPSEPPLLVVTPEAAERARHFTGSYLNVRHSRSTLEKLNALRGGQTYVSVKDDGTLDIYGMRFAEVEPMVYRRVDGFERAAFREDRNGRVTHLFLDQDAHEKVSWYDTSLCQQLLLCFFCLAFIAAFFGWSDAAPEWDRDRTAAAGGAPAQRALALARTVSSLNLFFMAAIVAVFVRSDAGEVWFGFPRILALLLCLPFLSAVLSLGLAVAAVFAWCKGYWSSRRRLQYSVIAAAATGFIPYLYYWNLLGFRF